MGSLLKRLYDRLNEDPSRYRVEDGGGNAIPLEVYQSDVEHAIAVLDPNGAAPKTYRYRRVHGWGYKRWRLEGVESGNLLMPGTPLALRYHLYETGDGGWQETLVSRVREDILHPGSLPEPEDIPPKVLPQFAPRPYDGMSPDEPDPTARVRPQKKWTPYVAVNVSWKL